MQDTGSLLLATNELEAEQLKERTAQLAEKGLVPEVLDSQSLRDAEPALHVPDIMNGLRLQTDAQIVNLRTFTIQSLSPNYYALVLATCA